MKKQTERETWLDMPESYKIGVLLFNLADVAYMKQSEGDIYKAAANQLKHLGVKLSDFDLIKDMSINQIIDILSTHNKAIKGFDK